MHDRHDPIDAALQSRRIPHARSRKHKGGKNKANGSTFNPLQALGRYEVQLGSGTKKAANSELSQQDPQSWLEIHGLTPEDNGFLGTFDFAGKVNGMLVLAGSRKVLRSIVEDLEEDSDAEKDPDLNSRSDDDVDDDDEDDTKHEQSAMEAEDERINRRARAFEKNTFRNPKFWMRWKGNAQRLGTEDGQQSSDVESNTGYLVFSGNDCEKFEGTISSAVLEWNNIRLQGWKIHSKASRCHMRWKDFP
ncbi:uncharacterized protein MYCFIDRAFT_43349 [Pseudocercospora fijiensis CIRAD86]|uniref:Uncharacterized protein n=1 Tax=Pseudocercospora fijiensis (strain CIRAD86) TaxID=383855 RepID=M3A5U6_PSEFD|nr:uncharacterized protein MYCFIDRAFT_43349 [Pseudocercospora fijiensis CIRAD86]EME86494.1 hypothetical protein MYCFIDRAFT_43349 [Pseudocercospora fijiensis CIRAD86]